MLVKCKNGVTDEWNLSLVNKMIMDKGGLRCVAAGILDLKSYGSCLFILYSGGRIFKISNR